MAKKLLSFIDSCIKNVLDKLFTKQNISGAVSKKKEFFICLDIVDKTSLQSKKMNIAMKICNDVYIGFTKHDFLFVNMNVLENKYILKIV